MREHPLLMQGPLVRATLEGRKTQTRRLIKKEALPDWGFRWSECLCKEIDPSDTPCITCAVRFPDIPEAGDRLWVRETFQAWRKVGHESDEWEPIGVKAASFGDTIEYRATSKSTGPWTPSIHMPRWACRLVLPLVSVRVERVQDITDEDAEAEGIREWAKTDPKLCALRAAGFAVPNRPKFLFRLCWISIYGEGSWDANPWVWVAEWKEIEVSK